MSPAASQSELVALAQAGDVQAFEELYRQNVGRVFALCLRISGNRTDAEDLVQEAFVRAWQKLHTFQRKSAFSTWMHTLTVNLALSDRRKEARRTSRVTVTDDLTRFERGTNAGDAGAKLDLEQAIEKLPKGARAVFVLHDVEGYKHREIARLLDIAEGTAKAQLHRARKLLREALR